MSSSWRFFSALLVAACLAALTGTTAKAVPYASAVRNTGGSMWEFVLNEDADSVRILRDGGSEILINNAPLGRHSFDMTGFSDFQIEVSNSAAQGWQMISDITNPFTNFERPSGLVVNTNPGSQYFGTVYVNNSNTADVTSGGRSRTMGDGIYALTADRQGVDLATFGVVTDPNDISQAKAPSPWIVSDSTTSAWRMAIDEADNLIVTDWSDANGGIKYASPDLTTGGLILDQQGGPTFGVQNGNGDYIHGSIVSKPTVTGSVGNGLTVWAMDEDLESVPFASEDGNSVWRWDVGDATDYDSVPQLVINSSNLGDNTEGGTIFLNLNVGVLANAHYEPQFDKWYLTQNRFDGVESGLVVVTADGVDGNSPTVEWASGQFSIDNMLDAFPDDPVNFPSSVGTNDIFQYSGSVTISPDGTKMFLHRTGVPPDTVYGNTYLGPSSNLPGVVLVIPLDENGLPDIQVDDNGTPDDPLDDFITNMESITLSENNDNYHSRQEISLDAAGNLYVTNNISELLEVYSPGGNTRATTTSDGMFSVEALMGASCDFDGDGNCDIDDLDALTAAIAGGSMDLMFDLNGDGMVTLADITDEASGWLVLGGAENPAITGGNPFLEGDSNLDGSVDVSDFNNWNNNKFTDVPAYSAGDFNADGAVDVSDFNRWNGQKFQSSAGDVASVPEPHALLLVLMGIVAGLRFRNRR
jgi:hypothetical protein